MNCRSDRKKYSDWIIPEDNKRKLALSLEGSSDTDSRPIKCPKCNRIFFYAEGDCNDGHFRMKCPRCHEVYTMSFRYFHTRKNKSRPGILGFLAAR